MNSRLFMANPSPEHLKSPFASAMATLVKVRSDIQPCQKKLWDQPDVCNGRFRLRLKYSKYPDDCGLGKIFHGIFLSIMNACRRKMCNKLCSSAHYHSWKYHNSRNCVSCYSCSHQLRPSVSLHPMCFNQLSIEISSYQQKNRQNWF
jgi:hypothetical protein